LFEEIVVPRMEAGLVQGDNLSVDGSFVKTNASNGSRIPREQLAQAAQVGQTVCQYLVELEQQNPTKEPVHEQQQVSTTDPGCDLCDQGWNSRPFGLLGQPSGGHSQLRDRGSASGCRPASGRRMMHLRSSE
jgi:hypothetical protein